MQGETEPKNNWEYLQLLLHKSANRRLPALHMLTESAFWKSEITIQNHLNLLDTLNRRTLLKLFCLYDCFNYTLLLLDS